jgi:hypothetical protein
MKNCYSLFTLVIFSAGLVLALSIPVSFSQAENNQASVLESIQQQLDEILSALLRLQVRLDEIIAEQASSLIVGEANTNVMENSAEDTAVSPVPMEKENSTTTYPLWEFMPLSSMNLTTNLAVLYRFSVTAGEKDAVILSVTYTITHQDISIKDLKVHAFSDNLFSVRAYDNATKDDIVGRRNGFVAPGVETFTIALENNTAGVVIPAGKTYYFELRGVPLGKNISAFAKVSVEGLPEVTLE